MSRSSDGGTGNRIHIYPMPEEKLESPWSLMSYPRPDPDLVPDPDREMAVNPERLYWRATGITAYGAGLPHPVDEDHLLVTRYQLDHPAPIKRRVGRPKKIRT